jgi:hypothetical protein
MKVERFEDLVAWQLGRALCKDIYLLTQQPPFTRDFALTHQIRKSAISIRAFARKCRQDRPQNRRAPQIRGVTQMTLSTQHSAPST